MSSPSLSIVIPALGSLDLLETTLVSVLQSRPRDCEIVVVLNRTYDDPYALSDEVRFLAVPEARGIADALNAAVRQCAGSIVHVLSAGVEVEEGWTDAPLEHFCDPRIAAIAPLVLKQREEAIVCSTGLEYACGGRRKLADHGLSQDEIPRSVVDILGPTVTAAFYRREALAKLPRAFHPAVGDRLFDVDAALQLKHAGYRAVFEPRSIVYRQASSPAPISAFAEGRRAERLFWRNAPLVGLFKSLATHPFAVLGELFDSRTVAEKSLRCLGRLTALAEAFAYRRHYRELAAVGKPGLAFAVVSTGDRIRIDGAHPHSAALGGNAKVSVEKRGGDESGRAA